MKEALESTKKAVGLRIDELLSEKEGAITAVKYFCCRLRKVR